MAASPAARSCAICPRGSGPRCCWRGCWPPRPTWRSWTSRPRRWTPWPSSARSRCCARESQRARPGGRGDHPPAGAGRAASPTRCCSWTATTAWRWRRRRRSCSPTPRSGASTAKLTARRSPQAVEPDRRRRHLGRLRRRLGAVPRSAAVRADRRRPCWASWACTWCCGGWCSSPWRSPSRRRWAWRWRSSRTSTWACTSIRSSGRWRCALLATLLLSLDPRSLRLPRESLLGFAFALTGGAHDPDRGPHRAGGARHPRHPVRLGGAGAARGPGGGGRSPAALVLLLHLWWYRGLVFASFDPDAARVQGLPVRFLNAVPARLGRGDGGRVGPGAGRAAGVRPGDPARHHRAGAGPAHCPGPSWWPPCWARWRAPPATCSRSSSSSRSAAARPWSPAPSCCWPAPPATGPHAQAAADRLAGQRSALARNASHMYCDMPVPKRSMFAVKRGSLTYSSPSPRCIPVGRGRTSG